ncbi:DinB family protein [Cyclobacterium sp.]|uniref:DinB family protein n=1 Tax=Cyclobacterium sp. TaxID=1966343 RepID=UPI0019BF547A|nr:DinB family protein [Cyclobacterium sp.]MBD3629542.1 DinB family protein [Cyclobacterium sp.]
MPEAWLRGAVPEIPFLLQPAAHALIQSAEDLKIYMENFREEYLWEKVAGRAAVGFHIQHMAGVIDRLFSYAAGKSLNSKQLEYLKKEGIPDPGLTSQMLVDTFENKVMQALAIFKSTTAETLMEPRYVGRKRLPSTVLGLYFHAAEHSQRHLGQLLVTVSVLKEKEEKRI